MFGIPGSFGASLSQATAGASSGLLQGEMANRDQAERDRRFGLMQNQDIRAQQMHDLGMKEYERVLAENEDRNAMAGFAALGELSGGPSSPVGGPQMGGAGPVGLRLPGGRQMAMAGGGGVGGARVPATPTSLAQGVVGKEELASYKGEGTFLGNPNDHLLEANKLGGQIQMKREQIMQQVNMVAEQRGIQPGTPAYAKLAGLAYQSSGLPQMVQEMQMSKQRAMIAQRDQDVRNAAGLMRSADFERLFSPSEDGQPSLGQRIGLDPGMFYDRNGRPKFTVVEGNDKTPGHIRFKSGSTISFDALTHLQNRGITSEDSAKYMNEAAKTFETERSAMVREQQKTLQAKIAAQPTFVRELEARFGPNWQQNPDAQAIFESVKTGKKEPTVSELKKDARAEYARIVKEGPGAGESKESFEARKQAALRDLHELGGTSVVAEPEVETPGVLRQAWSMFTGSPEKALPKPTGRTSFSLRPEIVNGEAGTPAVPSGQQAAPRLEVNMKTSQKNGTYRTRDGRIATVVDGKITSIREVPGSKKE